MLRYSEAWINGGYGIFYGHGYSGWSGFGTGDDNSDRTGYGDGDNWGDGDGCGRGDGYGGTIKAFPENKEGYPC